MKFMLSHTPENWELLEEISRKNHKGRGIQNMIIVELTKKYGKIDVGELESIEKGERKKRGFEIPPRLQRVVAFLAKKEGVRPATFIDNNIMLPIIQNYTGRDSQP